MYLVFGAVFLIVGLGLLVGGLQDAGHERAYAQRGRVVDGVVTGKSIERASSEGRGHGTRYEVAYRFMAPAGRVVDGVAKVDVDQWERLAPGDVFRVVYLSNAPESSRAADADDTTTPWVLVGLGSVFTLIGCAIVTATLRAMWRSRPV
jgi:hypothetical protein